MSHHDTATTWESVTSSGIPREEVGEDMGQVLPSGDGANWTLSTSIDDFRP